MKLSNYLLGVVAVAALSGCNQNQGNATNNEPLNLTPVAPPKGGDWTQTISETEAGGMLMGNPDAKVKLIEIGSLSCPHCRAFAEEGVPQLVDKYVKSGQVSWEFRPYLIHGPVDVAADLIVRCNGPTSFFPLVEALYKDQPTWMAKLETAPEDKIAEIRGLPTNQTFVAMASLIGLQDWAAARGVPVAKSNQCLGNQQMIDKEVQVTSDVNSKYPDFRGTPAFVINGKMLPADVVSWATLEPKLREALR